MGQEEKSIKWSTIKNMLMQRSERETKGFQPRKRQVVQNY